MLPKLGPGAMCRDQSVRGPEAMIYGTTTNDLYGHPSRALRSTGLTDSAEGLLKTEDRLQQAVVDDVLQNDRQRTLDVCVREGDLGASQALDWLDNRSRCMNGVSPFR